jgi:hypothetical protein
MGRRLALYSDILEKMSIGIDEYTSYYATKLEKYRKLSELKTKYENAYIKDIWDFEVEDITDEDLELIKQMVDFKTQEVLFEAFKELQNK